MTNPYTYKIKTMTKNQLEHWYKAVSKTVSLGYNAQLQEDIGKLLLQAVLYGKVRVVIEYSWVGENCAASVEECGETTMYLSKTADPKIEFLRSQGLPAIFAPHCPHDFKKAQDDNYGLVGFITEDGKGHVFKEVSED